MALQLGTAVDVGALGWAEVGRELGEGATGHVYEVTRRAGQPLALKWYKPPFATREQYTALSYLVEHGSPNRKFLWPLGLARVPGQPSFGYVMSLRSSGYLAMTHLVSGRDENDNKFDVSFSAVITLCRQLAHSFLKLHARGLCYRDISFGNVFFDPSTGDVLICDNDHVGIDNGESTVLGTPYFMAPEVIRDTTYQTMPSTQTDLHSLAVMMFYALCIGHPLEGMKTEVGMRDEDWLIRHFGKEPVFVFDPADDRNRPTAPHVQAYWDAYPQFLQALFVQTFTEGVKDPSARVTETEWIRAMARLRDAMVRCATCGQSNFWHEDVVGVSCARCAEELADPLTLRVGRHTIVLGPATRLWSDRLDPSGEEPKMLGRVRPHPDDAARWGIQNMSDLTWRARMPDGRTYAVLPGKVVEAIPGLRLEFGRVSGTVSAARS